MDVHALGEMCTLQEQTVKTCREAVNMIRNRIANNSEKQTNILSQRSTFEKASKEYRMSRRLYTLVKGTTGNGKITLEQYIQAAGFDGIIAAANRRLLPMSGILSERRSTAFWIWKYWITIPDTDGRWAISPVARALRRP